MLSCRKATFCAALMFALGCSGDSKDKGENRDPVGDGGSTGSTTSGANSPNHDPSMAHPGKARLKAGFGKTKITPPLEDTWTDTNDNGKKDDDEPYEDVNDNGRFDAFWLAGFSQNRPAKSIHDDIYAVACVIDDGETRLGFVALDAIGFMFDHVEEVRARLDASLQVDHLVVTSTHNHEVPDLMGIWGPSFTETGINDDYMELVQARAAEAVALAVDALEPATLRVFEAALDPEGLIVDTRLPKVFDPDLRALQLIGKGDRVIGQIVTWANHPEVLWSRNLEITADYVGYLRDGIDKGLRYGSTVARPGTKGTTLYINGAIGGLLAPVDDLAIRDDHLKQDFTEPSHDKARALGYRVASAALDMMEGTPVEELEQPGIELYVERIELPVDNPTFRAATQLAGILPREVVGDAFIDPRIKSEMDLIKIGSAWIVTVPGELYPEIANGGVESPEGADHAGKIMESPAWRKLMNGKVDFVFGLANDAVGYIVPKTQWDESAPHPYGLGESQYGEGNSLGADTAPILHDTVLKLVDRAKKGK